MTVYFQTDDLEGIFKKVQENGLTSSDVRNPDTETRYFYVYDPD